MCIWVWESRTLKADLRSAAARQERASKGSRWQHGAECEHRSAGSDKPSAEIGLAGAGRPGAAAAAIEISPPANRSARPSRDSARPNPLLCSHARLRLNRCQIRLGEYPPPRELYPQGQQPAGSRRGTALSDGRLKAALARFPLSCDHSSMSRGACQVILKFFRCAEIGAAAGVKVAVLWDFQLWQKFSVTACLPPSDWRQRLSSP